MSRPVLWNVLLALFWAFLGGELTAVSLMTGFVVGFVILWFVLRGQPEATYFRRPPRFLRFVGSFLVQVVVANLRVARQVLAPGALLRPGIVSYSLSAKTDTEISLLANLITLTPGTLSLQVSEDRGTLYIHALDASDPDGLRRDIERLLERPLLEILR